MASSSFFKNNGTSSQLQGSASASAAAALASEQAALASENAAQTSETNAAASAAAALVSQNAAANSAASANSDASAASISATASQTAATSSSANAALTSADATQTAADRVQTGLDRAATAADAVQTAADRVQTGLDVTSSGASAAAALSSRNAAATSETNSAASAASSSADATATAADRVQTGLDAASTAADTIATAADRVQTGLDATSASNSASAANTSASAASASQVSAAASAASAAAVFNDFEDRYYGPHATDAAAQTHVTGLGLTVDQGDLYFNSTANEMRVYDGGSWVAASSAGGASLINYHYTATASQTAFSGSDDNSNTLSYTVDNLIVTKNGIVLEDGTDYTATDGSTITLSVAAAAGDEINVVAFKSFTTADMVSATNGGTFQSNVTVNGTMTATAFSGDGSALTNLPAAGISDVVQDTTPQLGGNLDTNGNNINFGDNDKAIFGAGSDLQIFHDGVHSNIKDAGSGSLFLQSSNNIYIQNANGSANYFKGTDGGASELFHNGSLKLATTATGVDVTGTVTADGLQVSTSSSGAYGAIIYNTSATGEGLTIRGGSTSSQNALVVQDYNGANALLTVQGGGNVGIGTSSPTKTLDINTASATFRIRNSSAGNDFAFKTTAGPVSVVGCEANTSLALMTNDTERLRIDSSGRVTMPYQPGFSVRQAAQSGINCSSSDYIPFRHIHTTNFNTGNHFSSSTGRFTAPVAGNYIFGTTVRYDSFSGSYFLVTISKNGSTFYARELTSLTGNYLHASIHTIMNMAAGDYCNVTLRNAGDSTIEIDNDCNFYGYLLG